jgi:hypothetical protein
VIAGMLHAFLRHTLEAGSNAMNKNQIDQPHTQFTSSDSWWRRLSRDIRSSSLADIQRHKEMNRIQHSPLTNNKVATDV